MVKGFDQVEQLESGSTGLRCGQTLQWGQGGSLKLAESRLFFFGPSSWLVCFGQVGRRSPPSMTVLTSLSPGLAMQRFWS